MGIKGCDCVAAGKKRCKRRYVGEEKLGEELLVHKCSAVCFDARDFLSQPAYGRGKHSKFDAKTSLESCERNQYLYS